MRVSTDGVPARDRFALFRDGFLSRYSALEMIPDETIPFRGAFHLLRAGVVTVARLDTSPSSFIRTPKLIKDGDDSITVVFPRAGRYASSQNEYKNLLGVGEGVILDAAGVATLRASAKNNSRWSIKIPRTKLAAAVPGIDGLAGTRVVTDNDAPQLLFHYLESAQRVRLANGSALASLFDSHVFDLVACALGAEGEKRRIAEQGGLRSARLLYIVRDIERNFATPELRATVVAARLGVTPRYVHRLLEETGHTFSELTLERRLERAMQLLTEARHSRSKIAEIAYEAGFSDLSYFNRTFRRRFGDSPSGVRGTRGR